MREGLLHSVVTTLATPEELGTLVMAWNHSWMQWLSVRNWTFALCARAAKDFGQVKDYRKPLEDQHRPQQLVQVYLSTLASLDTGLRCAAHLHLLSASLVVRRAFCLKYNEMWPYGFEAQHRCSVKPEPNYVSIVRLIDYYIFHDKDVSIN